MTLVPDLEGLTPEQAERATEATEKILGSKP